MRKWAYLQPFCTYNNQVYHKIMVYENEEGTWVFLYDAKDAVFCSKDLFYEDLADALEEWDGCIDSDGWHIVSDPLPDCQHDSLLPIRVKGRNTGTPQWGTFEILKDGVWEDFIMS